MAENLTTSPPTKIMKRFLDERSAKKNLNLPSASSFLAEGGAGNTRRTEVRLVGMAGLPLLLLVENGEATHGAERRGRDYTKSSQPQPERVEKTDQTKKQ